MLEKQKDIILNKKKIIAVIASILLLMVVLKIFSPYPVKAETDFDKLKDIAKEHCSDPSSAEPKCLESLKEFKQESMHTKILQQTAQQKSGVVGKYTSSDFNPTDYLTTWNFNNLPPNERSKYYKETKLKDGKTLREYWYYAEDKEIEIAPGIFFPAWTYNGQVPAPTIIGTLIGGFSYSAALAVFFLAIGAGAIFDVAFDIINSMAKGKWLSLFSVTNVLGFLAGLLVMYATGFLVLG